MLTKPCEEDLQCVDPGPIVIDEVMGMLITLFMIPVGWGGLLLGFLLFRVLDVVNRFRRGSWNGCTAASASWPTMRWRRSTAICSSAAPSISRRLVVMRAEIVAVGSEMLTPTHIDTNSLFITERLNELGIDLQGKSVAGDDRDALKAIVADALRRSDLLILTGGLGPTDDDLTRDVVADLIGRPLEYHADIFEAIEKRFAARGLRTPEINRRQAMVPRGAVVLPNRNGTAPGLWIEHDRKFIVLLPGPPRELKPMFEAVIQERLLGHVGASRLFRRLLRITGQSESSVEEKMQPLYATWLAAPIKITTTILASLGQIELHLTAVAPSADEGHRALDAAVEMCRRRLGRDLFSTEARRCSRLWGACRARGFGSAAAESCTGGLVMARLTEVPGSSDYVDRGVVVYSNQSKIDLLGVSCRAHRAARRGERAGG